MRKRTALAAIGALTIWGFALPAAAGGGDEPGLTDLVQILRQEGVLDEAQYNQLTAKAASREQKPSWTDRISLWGDFRGRYEGFFYVGDDDDVPDRSRLRYRFRLNGKAELNDRAMVLFRLVSGSQDNRSTNQTLGGGSDFNSDAVWIDRAYVRISPFAQGLLPGEAGSAWVEFGKVPNPYVWKHGKDIMLWDHDISLEGANILFETDLNDRVNLFANTGYYVIDELSAGGDPNLLAAQTGGHFRVSEDIRFGGRVSWFRFGDITADEIMRGVDGTNVDGSDGVTSGGGNIVDGLTDSRTMNVIEGGLYAHFDCLENWPITLYGNVSSNLSAESSSMFPQAGKEDLAWGAGAEIGDKKKNLLIGAGWWHIEANAFFSQFIDSDLFDGVTNREGVAVYTSRQLLPNTELAITTFWSQPIDDSLPAFEESVSKADRVRVQADMKFKF